MASRNRTRASARIWEIRESRDPELLGQDLHGQLLEEVADDHPAQAFGQVVHGGHQVGALLVVEDVLFGGRSAREQALLALAFYGQGVEVEDQAR